MKPEYYCLCCNGDGNVPLVKYVYENNKCITVNLNSTKKCPGCDGEKISVRAKKLRILDGIK